MIPEYRVKFYCVLGVLFFGGFSLLMGPQVYEAFGTGQFEALIGPRGDRQRVLLVLKDEPFSFIFYLLKDSVLFVMMAVFALGLLWRLIRGPKAFKFRSSLNRLDH